MDREILAVIPARGGSKGIRHKNIRLIAGRPLIDYVLRVATSSRLIDDTIVTSDDPEIMDYVADAWSVMLRRRPRELAEDQVTLDPVVYDAVTYAEEVTGKRYDIVVTLQPPSPTLDVHTLDDAITLFTHRADDACLSVVEDTHLRWKVVNEHPTPLYVKRLNRQWLPKSYRETGGFVISRRNAITPFSRFGEAMTVYPVAQDEAVDVDGELDWLVASALLARLRIGFVVNGNQKIGMGHVYRALTLAESFFGNKIRFLTYDSDTKATALLDDNGYEFQALPDREAVLTHLREYRAHIVINDILDTEAKFVDELRANRFFVANFEDLGEGSLHANLVFNALYELSSPPNNHRYGPKYTCLSKHFLLTPPRPFQEKAKTLLVTFGGCDENNITARVCRVIPRILRDTSVERVLVVVGPGYSHHKELNRCLNEFSGSVKSHVYLYDTVANMARLMTEADLAITSNGRTIYELASLGIPGACIAQNDRETMHLFSRYSQGFQYLGIASNVGENKVLNAITQIAMNRALRAKMRKALLDVDLRGGVKRVKRDILEQYWRWRDEFNNDW